MYRILLGSNALESLVDSVFKYYDVDIAKDLNEIYELTYKNRYDLYIFDFYYYDVVKNLRSADDLTVTIFLDEYYNIYNMQKSFEIADDYLIKPLNLDELKIKVGYWYRKKINHKKNIIRYGDFFYHINTKQLFKDNKRVKLSPSEIKLLFLFLINIDKPLNKDYIFDELESSSDGTLRVFISRLKKLGFNIMYERANSSYILKKDTK